MERGFEIFGKRKKMYILINSFIHCLSLFGLSAISVLNEENDIELNLFCVC